LKGEVIAINGGFSDFDKDDFIEIIKQLGGSYAKSLVKKCTTLIQGVYCVDRLKKATTQPVNENAVSREAL
jgi:NAD-dependent DNA ligase